MMLELPESFHKPFNQFRNFGRLAGCQRALGNRVQDCRARRHRVGWNIAIGAAGLVTVFLWRSAWPDLIVGLGIVAMNADAAREVWTVAREEHAAAKA